jgi:hypothetical protein
MKWMSESTNQQEAAVEAATEDQLRAELAKQIEWNEGLVEREELIARRLERDFERAKENALTELRDLERAVQSQIKLIEEEDGFVSSFIGDGAPCHLSRDAQDAVSALDHLNTVRDAVGLVR